MFLPPENIYYLLLFILFSLSSLIQIVYYSFFYSQPAFRIAKKPAKSSKAVSVIICARNESENLKSFLPSILEQDYPNFEVIVVNDCSEDESEEVLKNFENQYSHLRITTIHKDSSLRHSKKMALFIGIKEAKNELLLLTDADCQTTSPFWIRSMASGFKDETSFVLAYGGYLKKKGLTNKYIRCDTTFNAMQYMGMAMAGHPYMGVGRNLAYKKSAFFENKGFGPHLNLQAGDDDLFINMLAKSRNTKVVWNKESFTRSLPAPSFSDLTKQKVRHLSTASYYRKKTKFLLGLEPISRVLYYSLAALLFIFSPAWQLPLLIFCISLLFRTIVLRRAQKSLNERDLLLFWPLFDIISPFINGYFLLLSRKSRHRNYEWK